MRDCVRFPVPFLRAVGQMAVSYDICSLPRLVVRSALAGRARGALGALAIGRGRGALELVAITIVCGCLFAQPIGATYVVGGTDLYGRYLASVVFYDFAADVWNTTAVPDMITARASHAVAATGGELADSLSTAA